MKGSSLVVVLAAALAACGPEQREASGGSGGSGASGASGGSGGSSGKASGGSGGSSGKASGGSGASGGSDPGGGSGGSGGKAAGGAGGSGGSDAAGGEGASAGSDTGGAGGESGAPSLARGAVSIRLSPPSTAIPNIGIRTSCTAGTTGTYTYFLGKPSSGLSETDRVRSGVIESGQGLNVECSVTGLGAGVYAIRATLSGTDANSRGVPVSVTLEGEVNPAGPTEDNPGTLAVDTPDTANLRNVTGLPECVIGPVYVVKEGALLADFSCPVLGDSDDTAKGCQAVGSIAIERCLTED